MCLSQFENILEHSDSINLSGIENLYVFGEGGAPKHQHSPTLLTNQKSLDADLNQPVPMRSTPDLPKEQADYS